MIDFILEISYDAADVALDERVQALLFMTDSCGSTSATVGGTAVVTAWFESDRTRDAAAATFSEIGVSLKAAERLRVDWLDIYEQSLEPLYIGRSFIVAPDRRLIPADCARHSIVIPQEQAFGTGSHETTSLCIEMLEELRLGRTRGLDVGSGSGILAVAMLSLGSPKVIAFDNDTDAYAALRENRTRNGIDESRMPLFIGSIGALRGGLFGVITMNIIPEVILPILGEVTGHLERDGTMILSGILTPRRDEIIAGAAESLLRLTSESSRGEWWCGAFTRR